MANHSISSYRQNTERRYNRPIIDIDNNRLDKILLFAGLSMANINLCVNLLYFWVILGDVVGYRCLYQSILIIIFDATEVYTPNSIAASAYDKPNCVL